MLSQEDRIERDLALLDLVRVRQSILLSQEDRIERDLALLDQVTGYEGLLNREPEIIL